MIMEPEWCIERAGALHSHCDAATEPQSSSSNAECVLWCNKHPFVVNDIQFESQLLAIPSETNTISLIHEFELPFINFLIFRIPVFSPPLRGPRRYFTRDMDALLER